jgi:hypothetical protein
MISKYINLFLLIIFSVYKINDELAVLYILFKIVNIYEIKILIIKIIINIYKFIKYNLIFLFIYLFFLFIF